MKTASGGAGRWWRAAVVVGATGGLLGAHSEPQEALVYRTTVTHHLLRVTVTDPSGRPIGDLGSHDFALREDGEPRSIQTFLGPSRSPLEIVLLSDRSGSMDIGYERAKEAAHELLDGLEPTDCVRFAAFMDSAQATEWLRPDDPALRQAIDVGWFGGPTALYDALLDSQVALARRSMTLGVDPRLEALTEPALRGLFRFERFYRALLDPERDHSPGRCGLDTGAARPRQAILVITEGVDSASRGASEADVLRAAAFSPVPIFAASVRPPRANGAEDIATSASRIGVPRTDRVSGYLSAGLGPIAAASGGALATLSDMEQAHRWLLDCLDASYVLGFTSETRDLTSRPGGSGAASPGLLQLSVAGQPDAQVSWQGGIDDDAMMRTVAATESAFVGFSLMRTGAFAEAVVEFRHAVALEQDLAPAEFGLGRALMQQSEMRNALGHLQRARDLAPWAGVVHARLAEVQLALAMDPEARVSALRAAAASAAWVEPMARLLGTTVAELGEAAEQQRLALLAPVGVDEATHDMSRRLVAALGRAALRRDGLGLAGSPGEATLALRVRFTTDRRRRLITDAVLYARSGGNYAPIELELRDRDDLALERLADEVIVQIVALARTPPPAR